MNHNKKNPWGMYAPKGIAEILIYFTKAGLGRSWMTYRLHRWWKNLHGNIVDIEVRNIKYRLNLIDNITDIKILCSSRIYDKKELDFLIGSCVGKTFVDLGANIGYYSLHMARNGAKEVICVEPNPQTIERLKFNLFSNNFSKVCKLFEGPIGRGEKVFFDVSKDLGCCSIVEDYCDKTTIELEAKPLIEILSCFGVDEVGALKIDIEGYEDKALIPFFKDADKKIWPQRLVVEDAHQHQWGNSLMSFLYDIGYDTIFKTRSNNLLELKTSD